VVVDLIEEYRAAERPDYVSWGGSASSSSATAGAAAGGTGDLDDL
jgi:hypothetical protein